MTFRNRELPFVDLAEWLGGESGDARFPSILLIGEGEAIAALKVDSPGRVVSGNDMRGWPSLCGEFVEGIFQGVVVEEESLILVVDPGGICGAITEKDDGSSQGGTGE